MPDSSPTTGEGAKAFAGVMAVAALIAVIAAFWKPLADRQAAQEGSLSDHVKPERHSLLQAQQIDANSSRLDLLEGWREHWIETVPALDADQNGRLHSLEREVFGGDKP